MTCTEELQAVSLELHQDYVGTANLVEGDVQNLTTCDLTGVQQTCGL